MVEPLAGACGGSVARELLLPAERGGLSWGAYAALGVTGAGAAAVAAGTPGATSAAAGWVAQAHRTVQGRLQGLLQPTLELTLLQGRLVSWLVSWLER